MYNNRFDYPICNGNRCQIGLSRFKICVKNLNVDTFFTTLVRNTEICNIIENHSLLIRFNPTPCYPNKIFVHVILYFVIFDQKLNFFLSVKQRLVLSITTVNGKKISGFQLLSNNIICRASNCFWVHLTHVKNTISIKDLLRAFTLF